MKIKTSLLDKFRAAPWLLATLVLALGIWVFYPHQIGVLAWSLLKLTAGAYLGYWIDRSIFYYARPGEINVKHCDGQCALLMAACMLRRVVIMAAAILALGLGV